MSGRACPACGAAEFAPTPIQVGDGGICARCGYAEGDANRCPHCRAIARTEGAGIATVCAVCGGPRLPAGLGGEAATQALQEQRTNLVTARIASTATLVQGLMTVLATLLALAIHPASLAGKAIVFLIALVPLLLTIRARGRSAAARARAKDANDRAWQAAAEDAARRVPGGLRAADFAKMTGIDEGQADRLLTALAAQDRTRIDVGEDAEVRYSAAVLGDGTESEYEHEHEHEGKA